MCPVGIRDMQITVAPPIGVITATNFRLRPTEIGQQVIVAPAAIPHLCPAVEILAVAAGIDIAVDRTGTAQRFAARHRN